MKISQEEFCPLIKDTCKQLGCKFFMQLRGTHPQTGAEIDEWDCSIRWLPMLLIEGAKETRQTAAAIESFRNEMVRGQAAVIGLSETSKIKELSHARNTD